MFLAQVFIILYFLPFLESHCVFLIFGCTLISFKYISMILNQTIIFDGPFLWRIPSWRLLWHYSILFVYFELSTVPLCNMHFPSGINRHCVCKLIAGTVCQTRRLRGACNIIVVLNLRIILNSFLLEYSFIFLSCHSCTFHSRFVFKTLSHRRSSLIIVVCNCDPIFWIHIFINMQTLVCDCKVRQRILFDWLHPCQHFSRVKVFIQLNFFLFR